MAMLIVRRPYEVRADKPCVEAVRYPRVAFFLVSLGVGGAQKIATLIMNALVQNDYCVDVVAYIRERENVNLSSEVKRHFLDIQTGIATSLPAKLMIKIKIVKRYIELIRKIKPDVLVLFGPDPLACFAAEVAHFHGKLVLCERGCLTSRNKGLQKLILHCSRKCEAAVFQSDGAMSEYGNDVPLDTRVIPNSCMKPEGIFRSESTVDHTHIVSAGRLVSEKGFDYLIRSFSALLEKHPNLHLTIYGDGPERANLEKIASDLEISDKVLMPGSIPNLSIELANAGLFVLTSKYEGLPNTLIEAMVLGVPVVATDCMPGGARFLTKNGTIGGPLVPYGNIRALTEAMDQMIEIPERAQRLGEAGMSLAMDYSNDRIIRQWLSLFADLTNMTPLHRLRANSFSSRWVSDDDVSSGSSSAAPLEKTQNLESQSSEKR